MLRPERACIIMALAWKALGVVDTFTIKVLSAFHDSIIMRICQIHTGNISAKFQQPVAQLYHFVHGSLLLWVRSNWVFLVPPFPHFFKALAPVFVHFIPRQWRFRHLFCSFNFLYHSSISSLFSLDDVLSCCPAVARATTMDNFSPSWRKVRNQRQYPACQCAQVSKNAQNQSLSSQASRPRQHIS